MLGWIVAFLAILGILMYTVYDNFAEPSPREENSPAAIIENTELLSSL